MAASFNLIDESWIPCIDLQGNSVEMGLRDTLIYAHQLKEVYDSSPMPIVAIMRLLLCILHRVFGPSDENEWFDLWRRGCFDTGALNGYLEQWHERFELYGADRRRRFYQSKPEAAKPALLLHAISARGSNPTLFIHETSNEYAGVSVPEAARTLLTAHCFRLGGRTMGSSSYLHQGPCLNQIVFFIQGDTLFETLMLNLVGYPDPDIMPTYENDCPSWEVDDPLIIQRRQDKDWIEPLGYLDYLSWQSIRAWLAEPDEHGSVRQLAEEKGLPRFTDNTLNPMAYYRANINRKMDEVTGYAPKGFEEEKALWRDSSTLLHQKKNPRDRLPGCIVWVSRLLESDAEGHLDREALYMLQALGVRTDDRGGGTLKFERHERIPLSPRILRNEALLEELDWCLRKAEDTARKTRGAAMRLAELLLSETADQQEGRKPDGKDVTALVEHWGVMRDYWGALEPAFWELVATLPDNPEQALTGWEETLKRTAWETLRRAEALAGDDTKALKAAAVARRQLGGGLKKLFEKAEA